MPKLYPSVRRLNNYTKEEGREFPKDEKLVIQEKLDGSNVTIQFTKGEDKPRAYSRTVEIDRENVGNWGTLIAWIDSNEEFKKFQEIVNSMQSTIGEDGEEIKPFVRLHGEWLMQAKLSYNKTHANSFWLFDVVDNLGFKSVDFVATTAKALSLNLIPMFEEELTLMEFVAKSNDYVEGQKTLLPDSDSQREGVIIKTKDGKNRMKFVSSAFKEAMGDKVDKSQPLFVFNTSLIAEARVQKYIHKLKEMNLLPLHVDYEDGMVMKTIFTNLEILFQDFMDEEFESFKKLIEKQIRKETGKAVKSYVEKQRELLNEEEKEETNE